MVGELERLEQVEELLEDLALRLDVWVLASGHDYKEYCYNPT